MTEQSKGREFGDLRISAAIGELKTLLDARAATLPIPPWDKYNKYATYPVTNEEPPLDILTLPKVDGYLIGVGAGAVLYSLEMLSDDAKGIVLIDVMPEVVLAGRAMLNLISLCDSYSVFQTALQNPETLIENVGYTFSQLVQRASESLPPSLSQKLNFVDINSHVVEQIQANPRLFNNNYPLPLFLAHNFTKLKRMIEDGKIAMVLGDITNADTLELIAHQLPGFHDAHNLLYLSNIVDHITQRGTSPERAREFQTAIDHVHDLSPFASYLHTSQQLSPLSQNPGSGYRLIYSSQPPNYSNYPRP